VGIYRKTKGVATRVENSTTSENEGQSETNAPTIREYVLEIPGAPTQHEESTGWVVDVLQ
jgi:hypothetical protein